MRRPPRRAAPGRVDHRRGPEEPCRAGRKGLSVTRVAIVGAGIVLGVELALRLRGDRLSSPTQISYPAKGLAVVQ